MLLKNCTLQMALIYVCFCKSYDILCPHSSQWDLRAHYLCNARPQYYCLFDENSFMFTEICKQIPDFEGSGFKMVVLGNLNGRKCAHDRYQPFIFWTNGSSQCTFQKSLCRDEGQLIVNENSTSKDATCSCDYTRGYSFVFQPKHMTYCVPSSEDCSCYIHQCPDGYILNAGYECIKNSLDNNESTTADPNKQSKNISTEMEVQTVNTELIQNGFKRKILKLALTILNISAAVFVILVICYNIVTSDDKQQMYLEYQKEGTHEDSFIITNAFLFVFETVRTAKITVISGPPGCGKTLMSYHAAVKLGETDNYRVIFESNPIKLIDSIDISTKQVFVIDDIVGKYSLNDCSLHTWRTEENRIKEILVQSLKTKLIVTCRSYIYRNDKFSLLKLPHIHCDMLADAMLWTKEERKLICNSYVSAEETESLHENLIMLYNFLPLICMQYKIQDKNKLIDYFIYPNDIIENEMNELRLSSDPCFIALCLLVVYNNSIDKQSLTGNDQNQTTEIRITDVLNDMLEDLDYGYSVSLKGIYVSLSLLENIYTKETALTFTCINKSMFDMLVGIVGRHLIPCILKHGNSGFIKEYVEVVPFLTDGKLHTIKIGSRYKNMYFRRIIDDINNGFNDDVFGTVQMKCKHYQVFFLENILEMEKPTLCKSKKDGTTVLHVTVQLGYDDLSSFFVKNDKSLVNSRDNTGKTPLHVACLKGNADLAKFLIKSNAKINQTDTDKVTPFMLACRSGEIELIKFLLTQQVNINAFNSFGSCPLLEATMKNNMKVCSLLLDNKANVDCFNKNGDTPLHLACKSRQSDLLNLLIKCNIDTCINKPNVKGHTPLYLALSNGHNEMAKQLIRYGADPNYQNEDGSTLLHIACETNNLEIVKTLLEQYHVEFNKEDNKGRTSLDVSKIPKRKDISELLIEREQIDKNKVSVPIPSTSTC